MCEVTREEKRAMAELFRRPATVTPAPKNPARHRQLLRLLGLPTNLLEVAGGSQ